MGCGRTRVSTPSRKENHNLSIIESTLIRKPTKSFMHEYQNGNKIGMGGFAEVRRCTHKLTGHRRAVKIYYKNLFPEDYINSGGLGIEIEILKKIDHPNIVKVYEYFEDEKCFYITMEFCLGGELFKKIGGMERLTEKEVCGVMHQLFLVVAYLHSQGIAHRDLKPENILLEERGEELQVKIADFGNAIIIKENEKLKGETGTSYYMAPEVISGEYTEKCDEWSCGVILYMLLTGNPPFAGETDEIIISNVLKREYSLEGPEFGNISDPAKDLIEKLLVSEEQRITATDALNHPWFRYHTPRKAVPQKTISSVIQNLKNFRSTFQLKESIRNFIISQIIALKETKPIRDIFTAIDADKDGKISKADLVKYFSDSEILENPELEAEKIMKNIDLNNDGFIEYSQYLKASLDSSLILSKNNVVMAFKMLDPENKGYISPTELMQALSEDQNSIEIWKNVISEVSTNKDNLINIDEFIDMIALKI